LAGFTPALLVEWLALFRETLVQHLPVELAEQWHARAAHIGRSLVLMHEWRQQRGDPAVGGVSINSCR
jgi:hemoglobin